MNVLVDTSVWSLVWRRDEASDAPEVELLAQALKTGDSVFTTGLILQELLQGFRGPKAGTLIVNGLSSLPFIVPDRRDYIEAATLRNNCLRKGIQVGTIDALLARLCIHHELQMLSTDDDFRRIARHTPLSVIAV